MPFQYRKSIQVLPGVRVNVNRRSISVTLGPREGPHFTFGSRGRVTISEDLPGPFSWRTTRTIKRRRRPRP